MGSTLKETQNSVTAHRVKGIIERYERGVLNPVQRFDVSNTDVYRNALVHRQELVDLYKSLIEKEKKR
jgi:hypothetical protein